MFNVLSLQFLRAHSALIKVPPAQTKLVERLISPLAHRYNRFLTCLNNLLWKRGKKKNSFSLNDFIQMFTCCIELNFL